MRSEVKRKRRRIDWGKEITILGLTMELKYWILAFIFLAIGITGFVLPFFISPLVVDLTSFGIGIIGILLTGITILSGASKKDINTITQRLNTTTQELHDIKKILKKIEKRLVRE